MNQGINTRVGPIARTVTDAASILNVIAGYDPKDELTAFSVGHLPAQPYQSFTHATALKGLRIGVVREYMDRAVATKAELQNIAMAEKAVEDLRALGATIVDPGTEGLFTPYMKRYFPTLDSASYAKAHPELFPVDAEGKPTTDQIATFVMLGMDPSKVPGQMTIRDFPNVSAEGESKYGYDLYLARRGDSNIKDLHDLATKAKYFSDGTPGSGVPSGLLTTDKAMALDMALRMHRRFVVQQIILQGMAELNLDAVVYPTGTLPPDKIALYRRAAPGGAAARGGRRGAGGGGGEGTGGLGGGGGTGGVTSWNFLGTQGFPAITVPGGFTTEAYDRVPNPSAPAAGGGEAVGGIPVASGTHLVGPFPAKLPIGFDVLGRPFSEPTLLTIAAAYEQATHHRMQPPDFGPLSSGSEVSMNAPR